MRMACDWLFLLFQRRTEYLHLGDEKIRIESTGFELRRQRFSSSNVICDLSMKIIYIRFFETPVIKP